MPFVIIHYYCLCMLSQRRHKNQVRVNRARFVRRNVYLFIGLVICMCNFFFRHVRPYFYKFISVYLIIIIILNKRKNTCSILVLRSFGLITTSSDSWWVSVVILLYMSYINYFYCPTTRFRVFIYFFPLKVNRRSSRERRNALDENRKPLNDNISLRNIV